MSFLNTFRWPESITSELDGYLLRYQDGDNEDWDSATPLYHGVYRGLTFKANLDLSGKTVLIKAVSKTGVESINASTKFNPVALPPSSDCAFVFGIDDTLAAQLVNSSATAGLVKPDGSVDFPIYGDLAQHIAAQTQPLAGATGIEAGNLYIPASSTDRIASELEFTLPALDAPFPANGFALLQFAVGEIYTNNGIYGVIVGADFSEGNWILVNPSNFAPLAVIAPLSTGGSARVGFEFDLSDPATTVDLTYDGSAHTYTLATGAATVGSIVAAVYQEVQVDMLQNAGKLMNLRLIQDEAEFTEPHTAGAVSLCDALIPFVPL